MLTTSALTFAGAGGCQARGAALAPGRSWGRPLQDVPSSLAAGAPSTVCPVTPGHLARPRVRVRYGMTGMAGAMGPASRTNQEVLRSEAWSPARQMHGPGRVATQLPAAAPTK